MKIKINNRETETVATTLLQLANELDLPPRGVAIAIDNRMIPRNTWETCKLEEGVSIVIIRAACGG